MAVSGLAIPPDQNLFQSASTLERIADVSIGPSSLVASYPSRPPPLALRHDASVGPHAPKYDPDPIARYARAVRLDVGDGERPDAPSNGLLHESSLGALARTNRAHSLFEFLV